MFWDSDFLVQFLPWSFTKLGIFTDYKFNIQNKKMKMAESKKEHWKSNIEQLDASNIEQLDASNIEQLDSSNIEQLDASNIEQLDALNGIEVIAFKYRFLSRTEK